MSVRETLSRLFGGAVTAWNGSAYPTGAYVNRNIEPQELPAAEMYRLLKTLYLGNGAYDTLLHGNVAVGRATAQIKAIRSPIVPVVNWFQSKTYPRPLELVTENAALVDPLADIWKWSNWRAKSSMFAGWSALFGEAFIKVQADQIGGRVWFEYLEPCYVTDFAEDARGFVQYVRVDIPQCEETQAGRKVTTHTEEWDSATQTYRRWESDGDACSRHIWDLGPPLEEEPFTTYGIDFVPFVRTPFADIGEKRAVGAVQLALEAIFEADLSATNLHQMLYVDADGAWVATAAGTDAQGRPIPPMAVANAQPTYDPAGRQTSNGTGTQTDGAISVGKRSFWRLAGGYDLKSVVADINYMAALAILQDHDEYLERLMPALAYSRISLLAGDISGRAIRYRMSAAIDQVLDVRATALEKLQQADAMALTLGKVNGIPGFDALGSFDAGSFEHSFEPVDVIEVDEFEEAQTEFQEAQAYATWRTAGLPESEALQRSGYSKTEASRIVRLATAEADASAQRQQDIFGGHGQQQNDQQQPPNGQGEQQGG